VKIKVFVSTHQSLKTFLLTLFLIQWLTLHSWDMAFSGDYFFFFLYFTCMMYVCTIPKHMIKAQHCKDLGHDSDTYMRMSEANENNK